jgi:hypothetical protein
MKHLIAFLILLLAGPSLANAQIAETFYATSGSLVINFGDRGDPFSVAGPNFLLGGGVSYPEGNPIGDAVGLGFAPTVHVVGEAGQDTTGNLSIYAILPVPFGGISAAEVIWLGQAGPVTGPGIYSGAFTFEGALQAAPASNPGADCTTVPIPCPEFAFIGGGVLTIDVVPYPFPPPPGLPAIFQIKQATFTLEAPEPSTASLLLIAFGGLAVMSRRPRSRERKLN